MDRYNSINTIFEGLNLNGLSRDQVEQVVNERISKLKEEFGIDIFMGPNYSNVVESVRWDHFCGNHLDYEIAYGCGPKCFLSGRFSLHGSNVGPMVLYYPDGKLAAFEFHRYDPFYFDNSCLDTGFCVYFDQQGNRLDRKNFDTIYSSVCLVGFADEPRVSVHQCLVNDFHAEFIHKDAKFDVYDIRELLYSGTEAYLPKLEADLKARYAKDPGGLDSESFQNCIDFHIYRKVDPEKVSLYCLDEIAKNMMEVERSVVNSSPENDSGEFQRVYGKFDLRPALDSDFGEISDHLVCIERFTAGIKRDVCFMTKSSFDTFNIGPRVRFYPNGDIAGFEFFSFKDLYGSDITERFYCDINGRLTSLGEMEKQFSAEWKKAIKSYKANKELEMKKVSLERQKTYKRLSSLSKVLPKCRTRK